MTSPRSENVPRPGPADETPDEKADEKPARLQLSPVQVAAGALAAVSSAVVLSFFGVAGTVIGAALASIVSTVGSALYSASLTTTGERLRKARVHRPAPVADPADTTATRELPASLDPRRAPAPRQRPRWVRVGAYAAAVFVTAMVVVTGIELVSQQPVSALVGGTETSSSSTTIGELSNASSSRDTSDDPAESGGPAEGTTEAPASTTPADGTPADETPAGDAEETGTPTEEPEESTPATESGSEGSEETGSGDDAGETAPAEPTTQAPRTGAGTTGGPTG
ncbi:hypothetical protein [Geodermatophilus sp. FMUSA9-8]|uniref:hypothetical protein n=1 Tax=Geodermatophilus sp. FMUSA9-8 TaxID=3120155 RepID=UPI003009F7F1